MKVIAYSEDNNERKIISELLLGQNDEVLISVSQTELEELTSENPDTSLLILGRAKDFNELATFISELRKNLPYIYIIVLYPESIPGGSIIFLKAGADDCISTPSRMEEFSLRVSAGQRVIQNLKEKIIRQNVEREQLQVLDLKHALSIANNDRDLLKSLLDEFLKYLAKFENADFNPEINDIDEVIFNAETLGAEWVEKSLHIIRESFKTGSKISEVKPSLIISLNKLKEGIRTLSEFGFFDECCSESLRSDLDGARILLVEDVKTNRILATKTLKKYGCLVTEAENGKVALDIWHSDQVFDLILMDMNMPIMDGFDAIKIIRSEERALVKEEIPIIALTALAMRGDREKCLDAGATEYLTKPIDRNSLINLSRKLICGRERECEAFEQFREHYPIELDRVLIKVNNSISLHCFKEVFDKQLIDYEISSNDDNLSDRLAREEFDLVILDIIDDVQLVHQIRNKFFNISFLLIVSDKQLLSSFVKKEETISFPITPESVFRKLNSISTNLKERQKDRELVEFNTNFSGVYGGTYLEENIKKSNGQLFIWQKYFDKVGGDIILTKQFNHHGRLGIIIADVTGHDAKSSYVASWFRGLVQGVWGDYSKPLDLLYHLNELYDHDTEEDDKRYVCALVFLWDRVRSRLFYANSGIPGGLLVRTSEDASWLNWTGTPVGMFKDTPFFDSGELELNEGDRVYLATDGVLEALPHEAFQGVSTDKKNLDGAEALDGLADFINRTIEVKDDLTLALFEAKPIKINSNAFRLEIKSSLEEINRAVSLIQEYFDQNVPRCFDKSIALMAIREALLNAVEHGNKSVEEEFVDIDLFFDVDHLKVIISDSGSGFNLNMVKKRCSAEGNLRIQGRGIEMMEYLATEFNVDAGSITMTFSF